MLPHGGEWFTAVSHNSFECAFIRDLLLGIIFVIYLSTSLDNELHKGKESAFCFFKTPSISHDTRCTVGIYWVTAEWTEDLNRNDENSDGPPKQISVLFTARSN